MKKAPAWFSLVITAACLAASFQSARAASSSIVISQIYGGGGNSGATLRNDFVELFNRSAVAVSVNGWSIQYSPASGASWDPTALTGSIEPGQYYLVALAAGAAGTANLPTAQATGTTNLSATTGKIALVNSSAPLTGACPSSSTIVDFVGYGATNCAKTSPAVTLTNTTALVRRGAGCTDTDNNLSDFSAAMPSPRTTTSTRNTCSPISAVPDNGPSPQTPPPVLPPLLTAPLIFPHFAEGGGYQTTFAFNNLSAASTPVTLDFYAPNGSSLGSTTITLPAFGLSKYTLNANTLTVGWARATFVGPADVVGTETIQLFNSTGTLVMETSILAAQPDTTLRLPVYEKDGFRTGMAIVNLGSAVSSISLTLRSSDGTPLPGRTLALTSSQQAAYFVSEVFPVLENFEGTLELSAAHAMAAIALRQNVSSGIFSTLPVSAQSTETYFSPRGGISSRIVQEIQRAQSTIDIEIYSLTRDEIADALIAAKNRGVIVRILADMSEASVSGSDIARLETAGIPLKRTNGGGGGIMHNKVAIFDERVLLTGSYNWSTAAEQSNDENAIFIRTPSVIAAYRSAFDTLWATR